MKHTNEPTSSSFDIHKLLEASPETIAERNERLDDFELPSLEDAASDQLLLALVNETSWEDATETETTTVPERNGESEAMNWSDFLQRIRQSFWVWGLAGTAVLTVFLLPRFMKTQQPHILTPKGPSSHTPKLKSAHVLLYMDRWKKEQKAGVPLADGESCKVGESVLFGFEVNHNPGHLYLYVEHPSKRTELLFPFAGKVAPKWSLGQRQVLKNSRGELQHYPLPQNAGLYRFTVLKTTRPLGSKLRLSLEGKSFEQALKQLHRRWSGPIWMTQRSIRVTPNKPQ